MHASKLCHTAHLLTEGVVCCGGWGCTRMHSHQSCTEFISFNFISYLTVWGVEPELIHLAVHGSQVQDALYCVQDMNLMLPVLWPCLIKHNVADALRGSGLTN